MEFFESEQIPWSRFVGPGIFGEVPQGGSPIHFAEFSARLNGLVKRGRG
jgi:hypothetical protein